MRPSGESGTETSVVGTPVRQHIVVGDDDVGGDVLHREVELRRRGMWTEHGDETATKTDTDRAGQRVPGVVGLDDHGGCGRVVRGERIGDRPGGVDHLAEPVLPEPVDDRDLVRRRGGTIDQFCCQCLHLTSPPNISNVTLRLLGPEPIRVAVIGPSSRRRPRGSGR